MYHTPVLIKTALDLLALKAGDSAIDATLGDGGHAIEILKAIGPTGRLIGLDASPISLERAMARLVNFNQQITFVRGNFADIQSIATKNCFAHVDGIIMDLGVASWQLDGVDESFDRENPKPFDYAQGQSAVGLSFNRDEALDMRLDPSQINTAATIVNKATTAELTQIFEQFGDLRRGRPLAERIVAARQKKPIETTAELVQIIGTRSPNVLAPIFQALRIAVNKELENLSQAISAAINLLTPNGRLVIISYHSGEDRIVKTAFRQFKSSGLANILTPKPIVPSQAEQKSNSRSRSAKLRAIERI